ncbi:NACHT domain-containing protein [Photobacterium sanguinicancri]|uniref:NACHT domain-containing protein n=1 Tax=Photobacterium sanguinicancri TaxID=875932 RepID=UPI003D138995
MLEKQIVTQIGKASGGLINAYLKPKIEKVERWAKDKDLDGIVESSALNSRVNEYLEKLAMRVSHMTAVIFPRESLKLVDFYEPLSLKLYRSNKKVDLINDIRNFDRNYLLVDRAGMGKSTFVKYLVGQFLFKYDRVPILFELRKTKGDLLDDLAKELDFPGNSFNRDVFYKLLHKGKFVIILDGFDEVSLSLQSDIARQINELTIKGGKNSVLVTSREQDLMPELINCQQLEFLPLTRLQVFSLMSKIDGFTEKTIGKELENKINQVPSEFLKSPLSITLLYQTYAVNFSISKSKGVFYQKLFEAFYDGHDLRNKNGFIREKKTGLDSESFGKILRILCYSMAVENKVAFENEAEARHYITKAIERTNLDDVSSNAFLQDLQCAVPLLVKDGSEIKFFHKTVMEYFASEYLNFHPESKKRIEYIVNNVKDNNFDQVIEFIRYTNEDLYHSVITKKLVSHLSSFNFSESPLERYYEFLLALGSVKMVIIGGVPLDNKKIEKFINLIKKVPQDLTLNYDVFSLQFNGDDGYLLVLLVNSPFANNFYSFARDSISKNYQLDFYNENEVKRIKSKVKNNIKKCVSSNEVHVIDIDTSKVGKEAHTKYRTMLIQTRIANDIIGDVNINNNSKSHCSVIRSISLQKLKKFTEKLLELPTGDNKYEEFF